MEPFAHLSLSELIALCSEETRKFRENLPSDERYGRELFRRALEDLSPDAFIGVIQCFCPLVKLWIDGHPRWRLLEARKVTDRKDMAMNAFCRLLYANLNHIKNHQVALRVRSLGEILSFVRACLFAAISDTLEASDPIKKVAGFPTPDAGPSQRDHQGWQDPPIDPRNRSSEDPSEEIIARERLQQLYHDMKRCAHTAREWEVIRLQFIVGIKPRELAEERFHLFPELDTYEARRKTIFTMTRLWRDRFKHRYPNWRMRES